MNQKDILSRIQDGARLRIAQNPWGKNLNMAILENTSVPYETAFIHEWQVNRLLKKGYLDVSHAGSAGEAEYFITSAALSFLSSPWRARRVLRRLSGKCG